MSDSLQYTEDNIKSLDWREHIRMRPGMYIGKLGDGSSADDGIYIFLRRYWITVLMNLFRALVSPSRFPFREIRWL